MYAKNRPKWAVQTTNKVSAGFNRARRRVRRARDSAISTHTGGAIHTFGQCAARKFQKDFRRTQGFFLRIKKTGRVF